MVPLHRAVGAERVRTRHSASARFPLAGLVICLLQALGWWTVATRALTAWPQMLAWQSVYATTLAGPFAALLVALTVARERNARDGGTRSRPLAPATAWTARALVLALQLCALDFAITMPLLGIGWLHGLADPPVARLAMVWMALWLGSLMYVAIALILARAAGMLATLGIAIVAQVAGTMQAESAAWMWLPWTWPVRALLPLLGIHQNGTALEPGSPIWHWSPWLPVAMSLVLAIILTIIGAMVRIPSRRRPRREPPQPAAVPAGGLDVQTPVTRSRPRHLAAMAGSLPRAVIVPLVAATLALIVLTGVVWDAARVTGLAAWLVIPLGSCVLACLTWSSQAPAWRSLALRASTRRLGRMLACCCLGILSVVVAAVMASAAAAGGQQLIRFGAVLWMVGAAWTMVSLWLATRFGAAAAIGLTLVVLVAGLLMGGTWMAHTPLWLAGPLAWPVSADSWPRASIALVLAAALAGAACAAWLRALRRAAAL
jgi:ABC-2 type transport system permease protein